ncbi:MAG: polysaccharide pyruvyl transferase family protein [Betaproteobacteria bacterium]|nr:polysaccharide pyruvyl transferase family protein [Betaproteobacteria bacterium]
MAILRREFGANVSAVAGVFGDPETVGLQDVGETDSAVTSLSLQQRAPRWSWNWWKQQLSKRLGAPFAAQYSALLPHLKTAPAALEVGGDNYSLDYGVPTKFLQLDQFLVSRRLPLILWGASVGPFEGESGFAEEMFAHLRSLDGVLVRETESRDYLKRNGVDQNVHLVADPAFVMRPEQPSRAKLPFDIPSGAVGLNLSPLVAKAFLRQSWAEWWETGLDFSAWQTICVDIIKTVAEATRSAVLLVPHVVWRLPYNDDYSFLTELQRRAAPSVRQPVLCLPDNLSAAETKWAIGQCSLFVGARTHATIAALSSTVPTLSLGYSLKAQGINRDIYGNLDFCMAVDGFEVGAFRDRLWNLVNEESRIRSRLSQRVPEIAQAAYSAGPLLRRILQGRGIHLGAAG